MTRLILVIGALPQGIDITADPRPWDELVKIINTGKLIVGLGRVALGEPVQQRALALPTWATVAVLTAPPPPMLNESNYDMIYRLSKGLTLNQIAAQAHVSRRLVCKHLAYLKKRFNVSSREGILLRAVEIGIL